MVDGTRDRCSVRPPVLLHRKRKKTTFGHISHNKSQMMSHTMYILRVRERSKGYSWQSTI